MDTQRTASMPLILDHVFVITHSGAPQANRLIDLGFTEGNTNTHPGQGTSNRRFFLEGFTIEFLYVSDPAEARSGAGKRLRILDRFEDKSASPFGIVVRVKDADTAPDFPGWQYFPDYFPSHMGFQVGDNSDCLKEPLCICMPPELPASKGVPDQYANPDWQLTELEIQVPVEQLSTTLRHFSRLERVSVRHGRTHLMTLKFNGALAGRSADLRPEVPLLLEW